MVTADDAASLLLEAKEHVPRVLRRLMQATVVRMTTAEPDDKPDLAVLPETSGLAVAALVFAVMSLFVPVVFWVLSTACGILAERAVDRSDGDLRGYETVRAASIVANLILVLQVAAAAAVYLVLRHVSSSGPSGGIS